MLIPSIDLMGGKIVQLVQGEKKALEFDNFDYWIERFSKYPLVQVIDLDAARGTGNNRPIVNQIVQRLNCQVGGGIRSLETAREILEAGARRVIVGSALLKDGKINTQYAADAGTGTWHRSASVCPRFPRRPGCDRRLAQRDRRHRVRHDSGARTVLRDFSLHPHRYGRADGRNPDGDGECDPASHFAAARGCRWHQDAPRNRRLDALGMDAVVGMALYSGRISA